MKFSLRTLVLLAATVAALAASRAPSWAAESADQKEALSALVEVLSQNDDPQFQLDILKGISQALTGQRHAPMPNGWDQIEKKLNESSDPEIRSLAQSLAVTFGSDRALIELRNKIENRSAPAEDRQKALEALVHAKDPELPPILLLLLKEVAMREPALRALANYDDPRAPAAIFQVYPSLSLTEKRDALNTLASRAGFARELLMALQRQQIPTRDLTADIVRQIGNLKSPQLNETLAKVWGVTHETTADKKKEIERYKKIYLAGGNPAGDTARGKALFARTCQQCHTLYGEGGHVGPDLTGSNRSDLDYILENVIDPNAVIPNDYRATTIETKDDRVITGIIRRQDDTAITMVTPNETVVVPRNEIESLRQNELSMMPEGLLAQFSDQEFRDLIFYVRQK